MGQFSEKPLPESLEHLPKEEQLKELQTAITTSQLGKMTDRRRKAIESERRLIDKRFRENEDKIFPPKN